MSVIDTITSKVNAIRVGKGRRAWRPTRKPPRLRHHDDSSTVSIQTDPLAARRSGSRCIK